MSSHYLSSHYGPSHYLSSHYGRVAVEEPGSAWRPGVPGQRERDYRDEILAEDEELLTFIVAFLNTVDD